MDETHILVPLSGSALSERALPVAVALADRLHLPMRLLSLVGDPHELAYQRQYLAELEHDLRQDHRHRLVDCEAVAQEHDLAHGIVERWCGPAMLVMATSADIYKGHSYVGSAAEAIVRVSGRPALLVGPNCDADAGFNCARVVVALDGSAEAEQCIEDAVHWATFLELPVTIATVLDDATKEAFASTDPDTGEEIASAYVRHLANEHSTNSLAVDYEVIHAHDPATALAEAYGDDSLLVLSTHGRSGISRMAMGSVAADIYRLSRQPVLVRRPAPEVQP